MLIKVPSHASGVLQDVADFKIVTMVGGGFGSPKIHYLEGDYKMLKEDGAIDKLVGKVKHDERDIAKDRLRKAIEVVEPANYLELDKLKKQGIAKKEEAKEAFEKARTSSRPRR